MGKKDQGKVARGAKMKIDSYDFGSIMIDGKVYNSDVMIYPDRVEKWWRKEGHSVYKEDIDKVIEEKPSVLVIGTGAYGYVKVSQEVFEYAEKNNIRLIVESTRKACEEYNNLSKTQKVVAALHLTC